MDKKPPNLLTEEANDNGPQDELLPRMDNIPTTPNISNPLIINVPQREPQAPKACHDDKLASSGQKAQLLVPQQEQAQKEAHCNDNLASSAHQLAHLLVSQQESQARKGKARPDATLASSAQQLAQLLGECQNLPCTSAKQPEENNGNIILQLSFDWPSNLFNKIKAVLSTPCTTTTPTPPEFSFKFTDNRAAYNLEVLRKYNLDLGKAIKAQRDSPLGNGKKFKPPSVLQQVFGLHRLWNRMEAFLLERSKWPLAEISKNEQQQDLVNAVTFGNHKGASQKLVIPKKLIAKDIKYGFSLPVPLSSLQSIPGLVMALMNIMEQNTIYKFG
jgi:hypothetical protein